eukprot:s1389_g1.t2
MQSLGSSKVVDEVLQQETPASPAAPQSPEETPASPAAPHGPEALRLETPASPVAPHSPEVLQQETPASPAAPQSPEETPASPAAPQSPEVLKLETPASPAAPRGPEVLQQETAASPAALQSPEARPTARRAEPTASPAPAPAPTSPEVLRPPRPSARVSAGRVSDLKNQYETMVRQSGASRPLLPPSPSRQSLGRALTPRPGPHAQEVYVSPDLERRLHSQSDRVSRGSPARTSEASDAPPRDSLASDAPPRDSFEEDMRPRRNLLEALHADAETEKTAPPAEELATSAAVAEEQEPASPAEAVDAEVVVPQDTADGEPDEASDGDMPSDGHSSDDGLQVAATEECKSSVAVAQRAVSEDAAEIASVEELLAQIDNTNLEQEQLRELQSPDEARALQDSVDSEQDEASDVPVPSDGHSSDDGREAEAAATEECEPAVLVATTAVAEEGAEIASMEEFLAQIDSTNLEQAGALQDTVDSEQEEALVPQETVDSQEDEASDVPVPSDGRSSDDGHEAAATEECEPSAPAAAAALAEERVKIASMEEMLAQIDNTSLEQARVTQKTADSEEDEASDVPVPSDGRSSDDGHEAAATEVAETAVAEEGAKIASMEASASMERPREGAKIASMEAGASTERPREMLAEIDHTSLEQEQLRELPSPDEARVPQQTADSEEDEAPGVASDVPECEPSAPECEPSAPEGAKIASMEAGASTERPRASDVPVPSDGRSSDDGHEAAATEECEPSAPEGAKIASMEAGASTERPREMLAEIDHTSLEQEQLRELPSPDEAHVPQQTADSEEDEASDVPEGAKIASMEEMLAEIDHTSLEQEQLRELPPPDEARVPQKTADSEEDEAFDVPVPSDGRFSDDGRETAAAEEFEPSAPVATAAVAEEGTEVASMEASAQEGECLGITCRVNAMPRHYVSRERHAPVPQKTVDSEEDEASDVPVPSDGRSSDDCREAAAAEEFEPSAPAATAVVAEEGAEIASMEELLAQIDNTSLEQEQLRELPSPDEEHEPSCEPGAVAEEQFSREKAEEQMLQLPADLPAPAEVSDEVLSDTSPSDLILRSVLKEAETLEKSRPRNEDEEEVDSDGGHPPLSPARNLGMALAAAVDESPRLEVRDDSAPVAAHGMSSMDFAIADDSDDAQHLADDEVQDDVPPVSGAEAVDSERARNLEEDAESEPPKASFVGQQPSASEALTTGASSLTGSIEGAISNAAAQGSDGSRTVQQAVVAAMFEAIDTNHDGVLSKEEFQNFLTRPAEEPLHAASEVQQEGLTASPEQAAVAKDEKDNEDVPSMQALLAQIDNDYLEEHELSLSPQPAATAKDDKANEDVPSMQALLAQLDNDHLEEHQRTDSPEPAAVAKEHEIAAAAQPATVLEDDKEVPLVQALVSTPRKEQEPKVSAEPAAVQEAGVYEGKSTGAVEPEDRDFDAESSTRASDSAMLEAFLNAPPEELHGCWRGSLSC